MPIHLRKPIQYPPVIRVRRPKNLQVAAQASASPEPKRIPFGPDVHRQVLGEFSDAKQKGRH